MHPKRATGCVSLIIGYVIEVVEWDHVRLSALVSPQPHTTCGGEPRPGTTPSYTVLQKVMKPRTRSDLRHCAINHLWRQRAGRRPAHPRPRVILDSLLQRCSPWHLVRYALLMVGVWELSDVMRNKFYFFSYHFINWTIHLSASSLLHNLL